MIQHNALTDLKLAEIAIEYRQSKNNLILLDYDGTLVDIHNNPLEVIPSRKTLEILQQLSSDPKNTIAIITGRDMKYISKWFSSMNLYIFAEHGSFIKAPGKEWLSLYNGDQKWKEKILPVLKLYADKNPGAFIEEKISSIAWHYRNVDPNNVFDILEELNQILEKNITPEMNITILEGKKVLEIKQRTFDKGSASKQMLQIKKFQFILCLGDDVTDEDMFKVLPSHAHSFKVGYGPTWAKMNIYNTNEVTKILESLNSK